jgi:hypothetical protein
VQHTLRVVRVVRTGWPRLLIALFPNIVMMLQNGLSDRAGSVPDLDSTVPAQGLPRRVPATRFRR